MCHEEPKITLSTAVMLAVPMSCILYHIVLYSCNLYCTQYSELYSTVWHCPAADVNCVLYCGATNSTDSVTVATRVATHFTGQYGMLLYVNN